MVLNKVNTLQLYNLTGMRGNKLLFEDLNCTLKRGDILSIKGPNGSGKTTLLKMISGVLQPNRGFITINSVRIKQNHINYFTYLDSTPMFKETMTIVDYLVYWSVFYSGLRELSYQYIQHAIDALGLTSLQNNEISCLSLGQRKRLLLCRLILSNRPLWLLDEPTIGLDLYWNDVLHHIICNQRKRGGIIIFTTHTELVFKDAVILQL